MKKFWSTFAYAVLAGVCIGLGGAIFLKLKDAFPGGNVVGAMLFTVGLFTICTRGYNLFTGKACYLFDNKPAYLGTLGIIWLGNLAGTCLLALILRATAACGGDSGINVTAAAMVESKIHGGYLSLFFLGLVCNIFIYIAVNGYAKNPHEAGKYLSLFLGVMGFIVAGTEHSVADMFYWAVSGVLFTRPGVSLLCLITISLGNVAGGVCFPLVEKLYGRLTDQSAA